jgi:solute carrier family 35 protein F5
MFLSDYAYNRGLQMTTVASCTVLISTACVFVLFLSVLLQLEPFKCGKLIGVILTVVGTALTTIQDAQQDENSLNKIDMLRGDMISLIAAVGYAVYSVQARVLCPQDEELYSMPLLLGYVGLLCAVPLFPMAIYQFIRINVTWKLVRMLVVKGLLDFVVTDYLLFRAVMLTNATVANVGLGLSIPMAFAADYVILNTEFTHLQIIGALAVLAGFVTVNIMNETDKETVQELGETELNSQTLSNVDDTTVPYNPPPAIV